MSTVTESPMLAVSADEIIGRLAADLTQKSVLAFDADGTLWSGDIGIDTFESLLAERAIRSEAGPALREEAGHAGVALYDDPSDQARALYDAFQREAYAEERAFPMMAWVFAGYCKGEVRAFAAHVVERVGLASRLHAEVLPVIRWATSSGVGLYVVSASPDIVVRTAIELLDLPFADVFAMTPEWDGDRVASRIRAPVTYGAGKTLALQQGVPGSTLLGGFGDSAFDLALLRAARVAVAVRPKPGLSARASECPGLVELQRDS
jgi:phosphoserine phosphatase